MMIFYPDKDRPWRLTLMTVLLVVMTAYITTKNAFVEFLDSSVVDMIQKTQTHGKTVFNTLVSTAASPKMTIILVAILAFFLWGFKFKIPALWTLLTLAGGDAVAFVVKHIVARARPAAHLAGDTGYSFPSGHVFGTFLLIAMIWTIVGPMIAHQWRRWLLRTVLIIWLLLVMASRIYLNAHFPTDTLGAVMLAYIWLQIAEGLYVRLAPGMKRWPLLKKSEL